MSGELRGNVAVVTGGASGIGLATVLALARAGSAVAVNYARNEAGARTAVEQVEALGARALAIRADVTRDAEVRAMMARVAADLGGIDFLVNNAGWTQRVQPHRDFEGLTDDVWDRVWQVNVRGPFYCVRAVVDHLLRRGSGAIVNVTSVAAFGGTGSSMAYAASKAALGTLTRSLARALAPAIRVNAVAPGLIQTGFGGFTEQQFETTAKATPLGRLATEAEVAGAILALLTNTGVTGETIVVDGGLLGLGPLT